MKKATYKEIPELLASRQPFVGNSCHADYYDSSDAYFVYSYATCSLEVRKGVVTYFNSKRYSSTTSKLQNIIRWIYDLKD